MRLLQSYRGAMNTQWVERGKLRKMQARKLKRIVQHAYHTVPYYRKLMDDAGVAPRDVKVPDDLARIPVTTKSDLRRQPRAALISNSAAIRKLRHESSSGSTGTPFSVSYDACFQHVRSGLFLRALHAAGYRVGRRTLMVTARERKSALKKLLGWRHVSIEDSPRQVAGALREFKPELLYGCTTPLRMLAEELCRVEPEGWPLRAVITTAETLNSDTREFLERTFRCRVFDFYGLTEMGLVGWECPAHRGYHLSEDSVVVEPMPAQNGKPSRLIMTNLDSTAMPFIRFDTGDIGVMADQARCACGRTFALLDRIEGRLTDCVRLEDGRSVTPYALTCRLERVAGLRRFQVVQDGYRAFTVRVVADDGNEAARQREIRSALRSVLGQSVEVAVRREARIDPTPGQKFRVVESLLGGSG
jgi:phenylacetate-CoA ligase